MKLRTRPLGQRTLTIEYNQTKSGIAIKNSLINQDSYEVLITSSTEILTQLKGIRVFLDMYTSTQQLLLILPQKRRFHMKNTKNTIKKWIMTICTFVSLFILSNVTVFAASYNGYSYTSDYTQWKQSDPAWRSCRLGNLCSMSDSGCLITSIAIQMARSGVENPNSFSPGVLRDRLEAGGYISHASTIAADGNLSYGAAFSSGSFIYAGMSDFHPTPYGTIYNTLSNKMSQGYYAVVNVKYGSHWVAVAGCENGEVYINDPANSGLTRLKQYDGGIERAIYFSAKCNRQENSDSITIDVPTTTYNSTKNSTTTNITSLSSSKKSIKVSWRKISKVTGYEVQLASNNRFTSGKKAYRTIGYSKKITGLKKGRTYYLRVRSYKSIKRKIQYSSWSAVRSIKCK
jgi:hypothetical protein